MPVAARCFAWFFLSAGALALIAARLPTIFGMVRNVHRHRFKPPTTAPLQPGQELDDWSEHRVTIVAFVQWGLVLLSSIAFVGVLYALMALPSWWTEENFRKKAWEEFEQKCAAKPDPWRPWRGSAPLGGAS